VIHLRETCCCSTNLCTWRPNTVYKNRRVRRHQGHDTPPHLAQCRTRGSRRLQPPKKGRPRCGQAKEGEQGGAKGVDSKKQAGRRDNVNNRLAATALAQERAKALEHNTAIQARANADSDEARKICH
jgi:hypothetical protein